MTNPAVHKGWGCSLAHPVYAWQMACRIVCLTESVGDQYPVLFLISCLAQRGVLLLPQFILIKPRWRLLAVSVGDTALFISYRDPQTQFIKYFAKESGHWWMQIVLKCSTISVQYLSTQFFPCRYLLYCDAVDTGGRWECVAEGVARRYPLLLLLCAVGSVWLQYVLTLPRYKKNWDVVWYTLNVWHMTGQSVCLAEFVSSQYPVIFLVSCFTQ